MKNEIILYQTDELPEHIEIRLDEVNETFWLSLNQISHLFERDKSVISRHLKNIFKDKELEQNSVVAFFATTAADGKTYNVEHFNLDAILSVGYRVNSKRGTQFRVWASKVLKDFLMKGYALQRPHQNNGHILLQESYMNNKLFFSGTETATQFGGYMEGAVISAMKIAEIF